MSESEQGQIQIEEQGQQEYQPTKNKRVQKKTKPRIPPKKSPNTFTSSNYRKQKCQFFNKGHCIHGSQCTYRHDFTPEATRTICKFFLSGACTKQPCIYSHNTKLYPCRFYHIDQNCQQGNYCRFSHEVIAQDFREEFMKDNKEHIVKLFKEGKLINQSLMEYCKDLTPDKEEELLPIAIQPIKTAVKVDPRLKYMKPVQQPQIKPSPKKVIDPRVKKQQKMQAEQQPVLKQKNFYTLLEQLFHSYY